MDYLQDKEHFRVYVKEYFAKFNGHGGLLPTQADLDHLMEHSGYDVKFLLEELEILHQQLDDGYEKTKAQFREEHKKKLDRLDDGFERKLIYLGCMSGQIKVRGEKSAQNK